MYINIKKHKVLYQSRVTCSLASSLRPGNLATTKMVYLGRSTFYKSSQISHKHPLAVPLAAKPVDELQFLKSHFVSCEMVVT